MRILWLILFIAIFIYVNYWCEINDWPKDDGYNPFEGGCDQDTGL